MQAKQICLKLAAEQFILLVAEHKGLYDQQPADYTVAEVKGNTRLIRAVRLKNDAEYITVTVFNCFLVYPGAS